jgi:maltose alpha-D-glucosyltransferase/alpha-amylase
MSKFKKFKIWYYRLLFQDWVSDMQSKLNNSLILLLSFGLALQSLYLSTALAEKPLEAVLPTTTIASAIQKSAHHINIPTALEKTLKSSILTLYGESQTDEVFRQVSDIIRRSRMLRSTKLIKSDFKREPGWYKDEIVYIAYAHGFGGRIQNLQNSDKHLKSMLPYLKQLGITTLQILSPSKCRLEQSTHRSKDNHCGLLESEATVKSLIDAAHGKRINIEYDFRDLPNQNSTERNGLDELSQGGTLPVSSLYPLLERISYWSNQGIDIFHLDANVFFNAQNSQEAASKNQAIVELLSSFVQAVGPRSILHVEAKQSPEKLFPYFGKEQSYTFADHQKSKFMVRSTQGQIATHYFYPASLWSSLILGSNQAFWNAYLETPPFTDKETWAFFLRNQDELNLEMLDPATRIKLYEQLMPKGEDFQKGSGVSGRLADFLDSNPLRITEAFNMLLSLPGIPMIYYGDAIAARSNRNYAKQLSKKIQNKLRKSTPHLITEPLPDSREIHRAPIPQKRFYKAGNSTDKTSGWVYQHLQKTISIRQKTPALLHGQFLPVFSDERSVLSYVRYTPEQVILVVNNLSDKPVKSTLTLRKKIQFTLESPTINNLLTGKPQFIKQFGQKITLSLEPYQSYWFIL